MKLYLILGLLLAGVNCEKKINLEDIERDTLRAESKSKSPNVQDEDIKYVPRPEVDQQQYEIPVRHGASFNTPSTYVTPPQIQNLPSEEYVRPNKYAVKEPVYQPQNTVLPEQNIPLQYYSRYQQQPALPAKDVLPNVYEPQQLLYQPEVVVGNQFQSVQQKAVTEKYSKNVNKDVVYVDIPMTQLLTYYPNLDINSGRSGLSAQPVLHQLATSAAQQISIPVYAPALSQKPIVPAKPSYQVQYAPKYTTAIPSTFTTKIIKGTVYPSPVTSKKFGTSPLVTTPLYIQPDQSYAQGKNLLYTQAFVAPSQPHYVSQLLYTQPGHPQTPSVYADIFSRTPAYIQDNSLQGASQYSVQPQQFYVEKPANELPKQVLRQQVTHTAPQNYPEEPEEPSSHFVPPKYPAEDFKTGVTHLQAVSPKEDESFSAQNHVGPSEPRSLLDTYVPSKLIAAQDAARYRERPIKLEGGFLPSKENFLHKKRQSKVA